MCGLRLWGAAGLCQPLFSPIRNPGGMPRGRAARYMYVHLRRSTRKALRGSGVMHTAVSGEGAPQEGGTRACLHPTIDTARFLRKRVRCGSALLHEHHFRVPAHRAIVKRASIGSKLATRFRSRAVDLTRPRFRLPPAIRAGLVAKTALSGSTARQQQRRDLRKRLPTVELEIAEDGRRRRDRQAVKDPEEDS